MFTLRGRASDERGADGGRLFYNPWLNCSHSIQPDKRVLAERTQNSPYISVAENRRLSASDDGALLLARLETKKGPAAEEGAMAWPMPGSLPRTTAARTLETSSLRHSRRRGRTST